MQKHHANPSSHFCLTSNRNIVWLAVQPARSWIIRPTHWCYHVCSENRPSYWDHIPSDTGVLLLKRKNISFNWGRCEWQNAADSPENQCMIRLLSTIYCLNCQAFNAFIGCYMIGHFLDWFYKTLFIKTKYAISPKWSDYWDKFVCKLYWLKYNKWIPTPQVK